MLFRSGSGIEGAEFAQSVAQVFIVPQALFRSGQNVGRDSCLLDENVLHRPHNPPPPAGILPCNRRSLKQVWDTSRKVQEALRKLLDKDLLLLCSPFDKPVLSKVEGLRANGAVTEVVTLLPFVLSLSKHEHLLIHTIARILLCTRGYETAYAIRPLHPVSLPLSLALSPRGRGLGRGWNNCRLWIADCGEKSSRGAFAIPQSRSPHPDLLPCGAKEPIAVFATSFTPTQP